MSDERTCFKCHTNYPPDVNLDTGMEIQTVHKGAPASEEAEEEIEDDIPLTARERVLQFISGWLPGLLRPGVMIASLLMSIVGFGLVVLCFVVLALGAAISAFPIGAVGVIAYAQALSWMMAGDFRLLHDALLDFESRHWTLFFAALFLPFAAGIIALKMFAEPGA